MLIARNVFNLIPRKEMRKRSFSNNVLEEKCRFLLEISLFPLFHPGSTRVEKSLVWPWGHREYGTTVTYSSYPRHFSFYKSHRFCLIFAVPSPSTIFFVLSLLSSRNLSRFISLPFVENIAGGNIAKREYCEK